MSSTFKRFLCLSVIALPLGVNAQSYSVEAKMEYETWSSGLGGQATAPLAGLSVGYYKDKYFFGAGFVLGDYKIKGTSDSLSRTDLDVIAGYQLDQEWSAFMGYRFNQMEFDDDNDSSFKENTHGIGGGVMLTQILNESWVGFATFALSGLITTAEYKDSSREDNDGKGFSVNAEGGAIYRINTDLDLALRVKYQTSRLDYESSNWPHSYLRLGASLGYRF